MTSVTESQEFSEENDALWQRFIADGNADARLQLIDAYQPFAKSMAARLYARRPDSDIEFGDYLQHAFIGLIESVDRYRPEEKASFTTFASYRIRGAVLDGVEKASERREAGAYARRVANERLRSLDSEDFGSRREEAKRGSSRNSADASKRGDANDAGGDAFASLVSVTTRLALAFLLEDAGMTRDAKAASADDPYAMNLMRDLAERLVEAMDELPERDRNILRCHYFGHMDFTCVAKLLGLSKGRVSQLHRRALDRLRDLLRERGRFDDFF